MRIYAAVVDDLVSHAREETPNECCGLLVGTDDVILRNVRTRNVEPSPSRYRVDPEQHFALLRALRGTPHRIVGAYHSHPRGGAIPSATDIAEAYDPDLLYVIVGPGTTDDPDVRGFRMRSGTVVEVPLLVRP